MTQVVRTVLVLGVLLAGAGRLEAHHSAVLFDLSKTFTLTGTLTKVDWRNPHIEVFLEARNEAGHMETWELETGAPSWFRNRHLSRVDLEKAIGQIVTVDGVLAKDGSRYGYLYRLAFAGGASWELR